MVFMFINVYRYYYPAVSCNHAYSNVISIPYRLCDLFINQLYRFLSCIIPSNRQHGFVYHPLLSTNDRVSSYDSIVSYIRNIPKFRLERCRKSDKILQNRWNYKWLATRVHCRIHKNLNRLVPFVPSSGRQHSKKRAKKRKIHIMKLEWENRELYYKERKKM